MTKKLQAKEYGISTLKGMVGAIPFAGTFLNEVAFEARSRIKQERVNRFIEEFSEYMNEHSDGEDNFDTLNTEQIGDIFEEIVISVSKTSAEHKRNVFKSILHNQLYSDEIDTDETLRFINITNELTNNQFKILTAFSSLSDNVLKYKVQIIELQDETKKLKEKILDLQEKYSGDGTTTKKLKERLSKIPRLIKKRELALKSGNINPNYHTTFDLTREVYISEVQDLISKGLLFDFALRTQLIDPFVHFGMTSLGRSYMNYINQ
ncbi:hypothetical protein [Winogradskyella algicola]|uniref:hypothetical protein n=1 Tax=Winogradskyella algicola TaxID=2575815 RepID=UPI001109C060|nr:hypothetical protein [Winogradskyella algicola]